MSPPVEPVRAAETKPPASADVVVIGGGIIGATTAFFLAERGISVALCEKGRIAGEQSSRNWGWCRTMGRDPREIPLAVESLRLWRQMNERVGAETGYRQPGIIYTCDSEADLAAQQQWLDQARQYQLDARLLGRAELEALAPGLARPFAGGLHTPSDGRAEPSLAAPAIATAAAGLGAHIVTDCAVRGIETQGGASRRL